MIPVATQANSIADGGDFSLLALQYLQWHNLFAGLTDCPLEGINANEGFME